MNITVVISAYNGEPIIENAIKSAFLVTDDVLVVDTESTDNTYDIAKKLGCRVLHFPFHRYIEPSRNFALHSSGGDWVFILDADEEITQELAQEIKMTVENTDHSYFYVPRKNIFAGKKWLQHGGWYPDAVLRLIKKSAFKEWPTAIHSTPIISGTAGRLSEPFLHYFHPNLENMVSKTMVYEDIESDLLFKAKKPVSTSTFFRKFFGELYRRLLKNAGFLDGSFGIIESFYQAYSKTITYLMLYEKYQK
jgi:hypothetical protein